MELIEKLNILNLSPKERKKMELKGLIPLSLSTKQEIAEIVGFLRIYDIKITKFADRNVLCEEKENIHDRIKTMNDLGEIDIYKKAPRRLCRDANDIKMKIEYCKDNNINYRTENGDYEGFLFDEGLWKLEMDKQNTVGYNFDFDIPKEEEKEDVHDDVYHFNIDEEPVVEDSYEKDMNEINDKTISFADMKKELERELASLDALRDSNTTSIMDYDVEEEMGMRRAA